MKTTTTIMQLLARTAGLIQIVMGVAFWIGYLRPLIPIHMMIGLVLVLALLVLAVSAAVAGVSRGVATLAVVWGLFVPVFGVAQTQLLPGAAHWVIRALHLLVGLVAMYLAETLATRVKRRQPVRGDTRQAIVAEDR